MKSAKKNKAKRKNVKAKSKVYGGYAQNNGTLNFYDPNDNSTEMSNYQYGGYNRRKDYKNYLDNREFFMTPYDMQNSDETLDDAPAEDDSTTKMEFIKDFGAVEKTKGEYPIHCLTIAGQVEGHNNLPSTAKATKYEHIIPLIVEIDEDPEIEGLLVVLNTMGGDVEAGLAIAELIAGMKKPTATLVLGGGHSIGIPLAVSSNRSFIVPSATMTVHPVRHNGTVLGVPQTMLHFEKMQDRITNFIANHSNIKPDSFEKLLLKTGELVMDVGTVLDGTKAVNVGLIDEIGTLSDAMKYLYRRIDRNRKKQARRKAAKNSGV